MKMKSKLYPMKDSYILLLILFLFFAVLIPVLHSGYYSDDILNSLSYEYAHSQYKSLLGMIWHYASHWAFTSGRLYPISFLITYTNFYFLGWDIVIVKFIQVISILYASLSLYRFISCLTQQKLLALLTLLLLPISIQMRAGHDPILSFPLLLPIVLILMLEQAIAFNNFCYKDNRSSLILSLSLFVIGLLTYEISIIALLLNGVVLLRHRIGIKPAIRLLSLHIITTIIYLLAVLLLRQTASQIYPGISFGYSLSNVFKSFMINIYGGIPFSYWISDPSKIFINSNPIDVNQLVYLAFYSILFLLIWGKLFERMIDTNLYYLESNDYHWSALLVGLILTVAPAAMMALSARYQLEINQFGMAYLPGLIQSFGSALILAIILVGLCKSINKHAYILYSIGGLLSLLVSINVTNNRVVIETQNRNYDTQSRYLFTSALRAGLLEKIPAGAQLVFDEIPIWLKPELVSMFSGKSFGIMSVPDAGLELLKAHNIKSNGNNEVSYYHIRWQKISCLRAYETCGLVSVSKIKVESDQLPSSLIKKTIVETDLTAISNSPDFSSLQIRISGIPYNVLGEFNSSNIFHLTYEGPSKNNYSWHYWRGPSIPMSNLAISTESITIWDHAVFSSPLNKEGQLFKFKDLKNNYFFISPYATSESTDKNIVGSGRFLLGECNGFRFDNTENPGFKLAGLSIKIPFIISFWIKPFSNQLPHATIISNHHNFTGITLEQDGNTSNSYMLAFGNSQWWVSAPSRIEIKSDYWSHIILLVDKNRVQISLIDNNEIKTFNLSGTVVLGDTPLIFGNWYDNDRSFNGVINNIEILEGETIQNLPLSATYDSPCK